MHFILKLDKIYFILSLAIGLSIPLNSISKGSQNYFAMIYIPIAFLLILPFILHHLTFIITHSLKKLQSDLIYELTHFKQEKIKRYTYNFLLYILPIFLLTPFIPKIGGNLFFILLLLMAIYAVFKKDILQNNWFSILPLFIFIGIVSYISIYHFNYIVNDEADNYVQFSSRGFWYSLTHYHVPNNHLLFSALNSIIFSKAILKQNPLLLRTSNIIVLVFLIYHLFDYLRSHLAGKIIPSLLTISLLTSSIPITLHLVLSRGYLLGFLFLFLGIKYSTLSQKKITKKSILFFILSTYCVPTFAYTIPGIFIFYLYDKGKTISENYQRIIYPSFLYLTSTLILHGPVIRQMKGHTQYIWGERSSFWTRLIQSFSSFPLTYTQSLYLFCPILILSIYLLNKNLRKKHFIFLTPIISFCLVTLLFNVVLKIDYPFVRNIHFFTLFILLFLLTTSKSKPFSHYFVIFFILVNGCFGFKYLYSKFYFNKYNRTQNQLVQALQKNSSKDLYYFTSENKIEDQYLAEVYAKKYFHSDNVKFILHCSDAGLKRNLRFYNEKSSKKMEICF